MNKQKHLSIRVDANFLDKFYYASKYNGRSGSGQIQYLMREFVKDFETMHGTISPDDIRELK